MRKCIKQSFDANMILEYRKTHNGSGSGGFKKATIKKTKTPTTTTATLVLQSLHSSTIAKGMHVNMPRILQ